MDPQQDAVSPLTSGDALMGRYLLVEELTSTHPWAFRWLAQDKILRRQVEVYLLLGPHVDDAIDAARSAALIRDPRLVRIIDAGHYGGVSFVLTEPLPGTPMTDLIPLDSGQSRALTGEVASALAIARQSDVHHGSLRPELVYLHSDPPLVIGGLGWDAALWGEAPSDHAEAEARDAEGVTALLYTALTGRWPGRLPSTVAPPPGEPGAPVKPSLIAGGVPGDLDALCEIALGPGGAGPTTLADVIDDLGPWLGRRDDPRVAALLGSRPSVVLPPMPDSGPGVSPSPWDGPASGGAADAGEPAGAHAAPRRGPAAPPVAPVLASVAPAMPAPLPEPPVPDVPAAAVPQAPAAPVSPELVLPAPSPAPASRVSALSEASSGPEVLTRH
ncbi:MAG: hypothetical protein LBM66_06525, partial [Bifidobacteriaceae bacterium]|nr:hypothetical protein [Bifidobacteriaceae bacterium]